MYMYKPSFLSSAGLKGLIGFDTMLVSVVGRDTYTSSNIAGVPTQITFLMVEGKARVKVVGRLETIMQFIL